MSRSLLAAAAASTLTVLSLAACGGKPSSAPAPLGALSSPAARARGLPDPSQRVFLIGLDGADWEIVDRLSAQGRLPNIARLVREGARGVLRSEDPLLSPIVWTTIATGRPPTEHGIVGFLTERHGATEPVRSDERKVRAFWNVATDLGVKVGVIGWYASWPAEKVDGFLISDRVGSHQVAGASGRGGAAITWPDSLAPEIEGLRGDIEREIDASAAARFFSAGHPGGPRASGKGSLVRIDDRRLTTFLGILRTTELNRRLAPVLMAREDPAIFAVYFEGTDAVGHLFAEFAPPPLPSSSAVDAEHFGQTFDSYYEYIDTVVGELAGGLDRRRATLMIVSDHGFRTGARRPRTAPVTGYANQAPLWHRPEGILLLWGRGIKTGTSLPESSIYDVFPTMFRLLGLPLARTLRGRPVEAAFTEDVLARPISTVADYEELGKREMRATGEVSSDEEMEKLHALGYIGASKVAGGSGQAAVPLNRYNEGLVLLKAGKKEEALAAFRALQKDQPSFPPGFLGEGMVQLEEGNALAAGAVLEKAVAIDSRMAGGWAMLGEAQLLSGREEDGLRSLSWALEIEPTQGRPALLLAEVLSHRRRFQDASRFFEVSRRFSTQPGEKAAACVGLAVIAEENRHVAEAASLYEESLRIAPGFARALERYANLELFRDRPGHAVELLETLLASRSETAPLLALYGRALIAAGRRGNAITTLRKSLALDPRQSEARRLLDSLENSK